MQSYLRNAAIGVSVVLLFGGGGSFAMGQDQFTDRRGFTWIATGPVSYSDGPMTLPVEGPDESLGEAEPAAMSVQEIEAMYQPVLEINGIEYRLSAEDARTFALKLHRILAGSEWSPRALPSREPLGTAAERTRRTKADPSRPAAVFGADDRYSINQHAHRQPYARIAKTWSDTSVCTAFKVYNHHTAMTAAHCVHDGPGGDWRTRHQLQFAAASNRPGGLGGAKNPLPTECYGRVVPGGWVSTRERQFDYAVLYLHGRSGAWCNFDDYNVGYYGYTEVTGSGISGYVSGYPDYITSPNGEWGDLWYAASPDGYQSGNTIQHTVDATAGQSGSPFATRTDDVTSQIMGVNVAETSDYNIASRVQSAMINFIITYAGY